MQLGDKTTGRKKSVLLSYAIDSFDRLNLLHGELCYHSAGAGSHDGVAGRL